MKKNVIIGQSGGPTAVINASLYGVVREALKSSDRIDHVFGMVNGIEGLLQDQVLDMIPLADSGELELVRTTPGAYLGSCRFKLPSDMKDAIYRELFRKFEEYNIGYFFYIGGNDSMDTVSKLSAFAELSGSEIRFIGIPKTIDNDLIQTDHTPGYGSAAKYVASTVREISADAAVYDNKKSVTIVEVMGRHAGWLTAASALARKFKGDNPVLIYLPETAFDPEKFLKDVKKALETTPNLVICISEGINDGKGTFICELSSDVNVDTFGHKMLTGAGKYLENLVKDRIGVKVRSVELNVCQRCSASMLSLTDQQEAAEAGACGVRCALEGKTGKMIAFERQESQDYMISYVARDVAEICNREKTVPLEWIIPENADVSEDFIEYVRPLIIGEVDIPMKDGLPQFAYRK